MADRTCTIGACSRDHYARGMCKLHYDRWRTTGSVNSLTFEDRFWAKVDRSDPDGCWLWTGATYSTGYGSSWLPRTGGSTNAHRVAWELHHGRAPGDLEVLHRCDTPLCVRPDHLELGPHAANMADMASKDRADRGISRWAAKLTDVQVEEIRDRYGAGGVLQRELATEFGVAQSVISDVVTRRMWRHVGAEVVR